MNVSPAATVYLESQVFRKLKKAHNNVPPQFLIPNS